MKREVCTLLRRGPQVEVNYNKINWSQNNEANGLLVRFNQVTIFKMSQNNERFDRELNLFLEPRTYHLRSILQTALSLLDLRRN